MKHVFNNFAYSNSLDMFRLDIDNETYHIPSDYFPLGSSSATTDKKDEGEIFYWNNTRTLKNEKIKKVFDSQKPRIGCCYSNSQNFYDDLLKAGISKHHLKTYVGWVVILNNLPVHHCWLVYKDRYILDLTMFNDEKEMLDTIVKKGWDVNNIDDGRKALALLHHQKKNMTNSEKAIFGRTKQYLYYIGCECSPKDGIQIYNDMMKKYPNHVCYDNIDRNGMTKTQKMIIAPVEK